MRFDPQTRSQMLSRQRTPYKTRARPKLACSHQTTKGIAKQFRVFSSNTDPAKQRLVAKWYGGEEGRLLRQKAQRRLSIQTTSDVWEIRTDSLCR